MSVTNDDQNIQKLLQSRLIYFLFTITYKVAFKDFTYFLGTANLRNKFLLVRAISIACTILCKRICSGSFCKTGEVIIQEFTT